MNNKNKVVIKVPEYKPKQWQDVFKNKIDDKEYFDLVSKLLLY